MKVALTALALGVLLCGCSARAQEEVPAPSAEPAGAAGIPSAYTNETWGYTLNLPEELAAACEVSESEDGKTAMFLLKESGDMIMAVEVITTEEWKKQQGLWSGTYYLGETGENIFYLQPPTCGTLNKESVRATWERLTGLVREMGPQDFMLLPVEE